jgi:nucleoside-diphosphate-sugar epimerase
VEAAGAVIGLTGATGYIGGLLLDRLLADPDVAEVRSVARRPLDQRLLKGREGEPRLVHTCADLRTSAARTAMDGVDLLYHLAAQVWQGRGPAALSDMEAVNVGGSTNVMRAGAGAVVLASSASVYGSWPDNPLPMDETWPARPNPECPYAAHKLASEQSCMTEASRWAVVRLAAVLGPHADARVARAVRGYRLVVPAVKGAPQAVQWLDEEDAVEALLAVGRDLMADGRVAGQVVNVAPADWLSSADTVRVAGGRALEVPRWLVIGAAQLARRWRLTPFGADRAALINGPLTLSVAKVEGLIGWRPTRTSVDVLTAAVGRDWRLSPLNRPS